ncbi:MAG: hypothetical protein KIT00_12470 [Rhodospirillales bacterium]|nr:hypothetical protein [Rhodospirillales bacterium]
MTADHAVSNNSPDTTRKDNAKMADTPPDDAAKDAKIAALQSQVEELQERLQALEKHFSLQYIGPPHGYFVDHRGL